MLTLILAALLFPPPTVRYHVLIVGVPSPNLKGFGALTGVRKDVDDIHKTLAERWSIPESSIDARCTPDPPPTESVKDPTTKDAIKAAITAELVKPCLDAPQDGSTDVVYFAFAGHGYQVLDTGNKEHPVNEAIVPSNARPLAADVPDRGLKQGEPDPDSLITGQELAELFKPLANKLNVSVFMTFDCCASGGIVRGRFVPRGTSNKAAQEYLASHADAKAHLNDELVQGLNFVCIAACRPDEETYDSPDGGTFTRALNDALQLPGHGRSYASLFGSICTSIKQNRVFGQPLQTPVMSPEVDKLNSSLQQVLGNQYIAPSNMMGVEFQADGSILLHAGHAQGIREGNLIGIFHPGDEDVSQKPWITAKVKAGSVTTAGCLLEPVSGATAPTSGSAGAVVFDSLIKVCLAELPAAEQAGVRAQLASTNMIDTSVPKDQCEFVVAPGTDSAGTKCWTFTDKDLKVVQTLPQTGTVGDSAKIAFALESLARASAIQGLVPEEPTSFKLEVRYVPVKANTDGDVQAIPSGTEFQSGQTASKADTFVVQVRIVPPTGASGPVTAFISVICVNPLPAPGKPRVQEMWPQDHKRTDLRLSSADGWQYLGLMTTADQTQKDAFVDGANPGKVLGFFVDAADDGVGPEVWKILATDVATDYSYLLDPTFTPRGSRGPTNRLTRVLRQAAVGQPIARSAQADPSKWAASAFIFNVVPPPAKP